MSHPPVKLSIVWNLIVGCALMSTEILHFRTWLKSRKRKLGVVKYVNINHISILPAYCKSCIELVRLCSHSGHGIFSAVGQLRRHMIGNRWTTLTIRTSQCFSRVSEINHKMFIWFYNTTSNDETYFQLILQIAVRWPDTLHSSTTAIAQAVVFARYSISYHTKDGTLQTTNEIC